MHPPAVARTLPLALALVLTLPGCGRIVQEYRSLEGFQEPHTPGSGDPLEFATPEELADLLGPDIDLNRVHYVRTHLDAERPFSTPDAEVIIILIPGFLGGATTFDPLARDLANASEGLVEVWAVDRRPNQLEDRLGALTAREGAEQGDFAAIERGLQFYFPDVDNPPTGNFPSDEDLDVDLDGTLDPQLPLVDFFGRERLPIIFEQDDLRFLAHWGVDTYMRDWKLLVQHARERVGADGLVLFGGHSQGTSWAARFAAYDFDPGPGVEAGHTLVDGLILLEGGGVGSGGGGPGRDEYLAEVAALETEGGPELFMEDFQLSFGPIVIPVFNLQDLGPSGETAALAGIFDPDSASVIQRTPVFGAGGLIGELLLGAPATNRALGGFFLDDDFQPFGAFQATMGYSDNGPNTEQAFPGFGSFLTPQPAPGGALRTWKEFDDPTLPTCPPQTPDDGTGCAIDLADPDDREVSPLDHFLRSQFEVQNGFEWYFLTGRVELDFRYGNDSSALGDETLLAITRNAHVDVPVLGIGGTNGLASSESAFASYFGSIATPAEDTSACILAGYAHVDPLIAADNEAVGLILGLIARIRSGGTLDAAVGCP